MGIIASELARLLLPEERSKIVDDLLMVTFLRFVLCVLNDSGVSEFLSILPFPAYADDKR